MSDQGQTYDLCEDCIASEGTKAARRPTGNALAFVIGSTFAAIALLGLQNPSENSPSSAGSIEVRLDVATTLAKSFPDDGFSALGIVAALIVAIALSTGQSVQRISVLESEALAAGGVVNLNALRRLRAMDSVLRSEIVIALLCMAVALIIAACAFIKGDAVSILLGSISCLCVGWLAFQVGHVRAVMHLSADIRSVLDAPFQRKVRERVELVRPRSSRWAVLVWWVLYILPGAIAAIAPSHDADLQARVIAALLVTLFGVLTQVSLSAASSSALIEDGWERGFTIAFASLVGFSIATALSLSVTELIWDDKTPVFAILFLMAWYTTLGSLLSWGAAGGGPLKAAAQRYTGSLPELRRPGRPMPSTAQQATSWAVVAIVGVGLPVLVAGVTRGVEPAGASALVLAGLLVVVLRISGFALFSAGNVRRTAVGIVLVVGGVGAAWNVALLRDEGAWGWVCALLFSCAALYACADIVWQVHGGRLAHRFIVAQSRREKPVRDVLITPEERNRNRTCSVPGCRNAILTP